MHTLTFDNHTVTADIEPHGRFTTIRSRFDDNKDFIPEVLRRLVERRYRELDLELAPDIPHECLVVMWLEISPERI